MFSLDVTSNVGDISVKTTNNKGLSPEYWTERIIDRLISISDNADPMVKAQAQAYKDSMTQVVLLYLKQAIASDRATVAGLLQKQGHKDMADVALTPVTLTKALAITVSLPSAVVPATPVTSTGIGSPQVS